MGYDGQGSWIEHQDKGFPLLALFLLEKYLLLQEKNNQKLRFNMYTFRKYLIARKKNEIVNCIVRCANKCFNEFRYKNVVIFVFSSYHEFDQFRESSQYGD